MRGQVWVQRDSLPVFAGPHACLGTWLGAESVHGCLLLVVFRPAARAPSAITVGATTSTDARPTWSNFGKCVDIWAPGSSIRSAVATGTEAFAAFSGTSMAGESRFFCPTFTVHYYTSSTCLPWFCCRCCQCLKLTLALCCLCCCCCRPDTLRRIRNVSSPRGGCGRPLLECRAVQLAIVLHLRLDVLGHKEDRDRAVAQAELQRQSFPAHPCWNLTPSCLHIATLVHVGVGVGLPSFVLSMVVGRGRQAGCGCQAGTLLRALSLCGVCIACCAYPSCAFLLICCEGRTYFLGIAMHSRQRLAQGRRQKPTREISAVKPSHDIFFLCCSCVMTVHVCILRCYQRTAQSGRIPLTPRQIRSLPSACRRPFEQHAMHI